MIRKSASNQRISKISRNSFQTSIGLKELLILFKLKFLFRPRQKGLKLNRDAMEFKVNEEEIDQNNEEDENLHVFIGFQQPLDLVTQNPINPNGFYQPTYPTNFPPTNFPQTNFPQTNFPQTNFPQTNFPQTNFPQNNYPQTNFPQNNYPQNQMNYGQTFYPTNNYPYYN